MTCLKFYTIFLPKERQCYGLVKINILVKYAVFDCSFFIYYFLLNCHFLLCFSCHFTVPAFLLQKAPTFMCRGFCPPDPLGAGFNINWDTVNLTKLLKDLLKLVGTSLHIQQYNCLKIIKNF